MRRLALFLGLALLVMARASWAAPGTEALGAEAPGEACLSAIATAEHAQDLPYGILAAIGRVETGRRNAVTKAVMPWPWSVDANGIGRFFDSEAQAIAAVRGLQREGERSIDVGCLQVNLQQHPDAFANLAQAFNPEANAAFAAHFLRSLFEETGSWAAAAAAYHSRNEATGAAYERLVMNAWGAPAPTALPLRPFRMPAVAPGKPAIEGALLVKAAFACEKTPPPRTRSWIVLPGALCRDSPFANTRHLLELLATNPVTPPADEAAGRRR